MSTKHTNSSFWVIPKQNITFNNVMLLGLPISMVFSVNLVGKILLSDALVLYVFFNLLRHKKLTFRLPYLRPILIMLALWIFAAVLSDLINNSSFKNLARGWAKLGLFGFYIIVIFNLIGGSRKNAALAMIGIGIALLLKTDISADIGNDTVFRTMWKFGMGLAVGILLYSLLNAMGMKQRSISLLLLLFSPVHLFLGARSQFLLLAISSGVSFFHIRIKGAKKRFYAGILFLMLIGSALIIGESLYDQIIRTGALGEKALEKHLKQTTNGENILLGGRAESAISIIAFADKPLLGHGSWAESREYRALYFQIKAAKGEPINWNAPFISRSDLIPTHSMLMGAAVEHGIAGFAFWVYILTIAARAFILGGIGPKPASALELLAVTSLIWDVFFSPFGATRRCYEVVFLVIAVNIIQSNKPSSSQPTKA